MSESRREYDKMSNTSSSENRRNSKDETERYSRKRTHFQTNSHPIENLDAKVYVGNISTEKLTDEELLDFFKPFGKVSDIRVFKNYIFVQYNRADDARKLIDEGLISLLFKGNKLDILPASEAPLTGKSAKKSHEKTSHRFSLKSEPTRKRFSTHHIERDRSNFMNNNTNVYNDRVEMEMDDHMYISSSSRSCSRQSSINSLSRNPQTLYSVLAGPKNPAELVDCQIILVNARQREYANEIESHLRSHGLITSIVLLREDFTLTEAIDNAARQQCLFGIVAMPMHEERRTASFHILYGQTEEHRNLTLDDGYHIIINNFLSYKERFRNDEANPYRENNEAIMYSEPVQSFEYIPQLSNTSDEEINPPILTHGDKLPLSMLLCLLADGRQLTLDEIDRVLVYLLEKKSKMLTLPSGTLPPLPAQYATATTLNHQTGSGIVSDTRSASTSDTFSGKSSSSSAEVSSSIAEQIRRILSTNTVKPHSSTSIPIDKTAAQHPSPTNALEILPNIVKVEDTTSSQSKNNVKEAAKEYVQYQQTQQRQVQAQAQNIISQQQQQKQTSQASFSYPKTETTAVNALPFNYSSSSGSTTGSVTSFAAPNFSTYNSMTSSLTPNSSIKATTPVTVPNFGSQTAQYYYQVPTQNMYQQPLNSTAADAAAAIFQAYAQFNVPSTATPSMVSQQITTQQQQIKK